MLVWRDLPNGSITADSDGGWYGIGHADDGYVILFCPSTPCYYREHGVSSWGAGLPGRRGPGVDTLEHAKAACEKHNDTSVHLGLRRCANMLCFPTCPAAPKDPDHA